MSEWYNQLRHNSINNLLQLCKKNRTNLFLLVLYLYYSAPSLSEISTFIKLRYNADNHYDSNDEIEKGSLSSYMD